MLNQRWMALSLIALTSCATTTSTTTPAEETAETEAPAAEAPPAAPAMEKVFLRQRLGDHATAQLYATGFRELDLADQLVAWHLTLAAHAGEEIHYDQLGWNNVAIKRLLEAIYLFGLEGDPAAAKPGSFDAQLVDYLVRFFGHSGNHDSHTSQKFVPAFTPEALEQAALRAFANGADLKVPDEATLKAHLKTLRRSIFDPTFEPFATTKTPPPGQDLLTASSNTLYGPGVTLADLKGFEEHNPLNSRVVKVDGKLVERVFRAGTADGKVKPGLYAERLARVNEHLAHAREHATGAQKEALGKLIHYFQTGDLKDWDTYNIAWLKADPMVDANIGFIETYIDARGQKGEWEALINYKDRAEMRVMEVLGKRAQYFEDKMPWPEQYKRTGISPPVAKAISFVDAYPQPPAGINLPNEQHIREKYGSKSVLVMNTIELAQALKRTPLDVEFSLTPEEKAAARKYGPVARKLLVAFHEVTGHASGKKDPKLEGNPSEHLKEYDNTLEEARADLVALWHTFDPALAEMGYPEYQQIGEQMYRSMMIEALTNLRLVEEGNAFEEDHQRGAWLTLNDFLEKGVVSLVKKEGKTYVKVNDYPKMHEAVGDLLTRLMVIKATGDYEAIKALVEGKGVRFDPALRDEVVARVKAIDVPKVILMTSPQLVPALDDQGQVTEVEVKHDQPFLEQHLLRSLLGQLPAAEATQVAAKVGIDREAILDALRAQRRRLEPAPAAAAK